jgi:hypothetical protein
MEDGYPAGKTESRLARHLAVFPGYLYAKPTTTSSPNITPWYELKQELQFCQRDAPLILASVLPKMAISSNVKANNYI